MRAPPPRWPFATKSASRPIVALTPTAASAPPGCSEPRPARPPSRELTSDCLAPNAFAKERGCQASASGKRFPRIACSVTVDGKRWTASPRPRASSRSPSSARSETVAQDGQITGPPMKARLPLAARRATPARRARWRCHRSAPTPAREPTRPPGRHRPSIANDLSDKDSLEPPPMRDSSCPLRWRVEPRCEHAIKHGKPAPLRGSCLAPGGLRRPSVISRHS
jgi:hypothetical protein